MAWGWDKPEFVDIDPLADNRPAASAASPSGAPTPPLMKKIKLAHHIDQTDDSETTVACNADMLIGQQNWLRFALGEPAEEETPTADQLTALNVRAKDHDSSPYADFAVLDAALTQDLSQLEVHGVSPTAERRRFP